MVLIGYHSTCGYKLYSPSDDKLVISRGDVLVDKRKGWNWTRESVKLEQDTITIVFEEEYQQKEATT